MKKRYIICQTCKKKKPHGALGKCKPCYDRDRNREKYRKLSQEEKRKYIGERNSWRKEDRELYNKIQRDIMRKRLNIPKDRWRK